MLKFVRRARYRNAAMLSVIAAATVVACGGGDDEVADPVPSIRTPTGPLMLVVDGSGRFTLPPQSATEYEKHLAVATANAGAAPFTGPSSPLYDPVEIRRQWCFGAENSGAPPELQNRNPVPPTQIFDNIWAFGLRTVLQYGFRTDTGKVFLMDTLNNTTEAQTITVPGITAMGLAPNQLAGAFPTHGHGDHHGGAGYLQQTYGTPIYLGSADAAAGLNPGNNRLPFTVTPLDSTSLQPQVQDFGGLRMTLLSTPGHTPGTFSGVSPAKLGDKEYRLAFWGGTAFSNTVTGSRNYLDGSERLYRLSKSQNVDGTFHTHPFVDGSLQKIDAIQASPNLRTAANPFLIGHTLAMRSLATLRECSAAKAAQVDATAKIPAWHVTSVETSATTTNGSPMEVKAVVRTPYGVLQNGAVNFTLAPGGQKCTAVTDAKGQASCTIPLRFWPITSVSADFVEAALADGSVQLGSSASITPR